MKIRLNDVPEITKSSTPAEFAQLVDEMFKYLDEKGRFSCEVSGPSVVFVYDDGDSEKVTIPLPVSFFKDSVFWPNIHFCTAHIDPNAEEETMTHFEFLYMILHERIELIAKNDRPFLGLLRGDIKNITSLVKHVSPQAPNAKIKAMGEVILFDPYNPRSNTLQYAMDVCMGDRIFNMRASSKKVIEAAVKNFFSLLPGSESSLSESGSISVYDFSKMEQLACGFKIENKGTLEQKIISIFPPKSQLAARLKTHLNGDAMKVSNPDKPIFIQDVIQNEDGTFDSKGDFLVGAVIKVGRICEDTFRFGAGEIEVAKSISSQIVYSDRHIETVIENVSVKEGETYLSKHGFVEIGFNYDENGNKRKVHIENVHSVKVNKVGEIGHNNVRRIEFTAYYHAGNARIVSHSGLKGVTKAVQNPGYIEYEQDGKTKRLNVGIIAGMNSLKAGMNSVRLAQAALAFKLGFYKNGKEYLDSMNEKEINDAVASLPKGNYFRNIGTVINEDEEDCVYGYVQFYVTEIGSTYARIKENILPFNCYKIIESGAQTDKNIAELFEILNEQCYREDRKEATLELAKCYNDHAAVYAEVDNLPVYSLADLPKMFDHSDLITSSMALIPFTSKLLDPDFNKGFYIHLRPHRSDMYVRVPSAEIMSMFCGQQTDGMYSYPGLLLELSTMIESAIKGKSQYWRIAPLRSESNQNRPCAYANYIRQIGSILYSNEIGGQVFVKNLINPKLVGLNLKQVHERFLPEDTVVIMDKELVSKVRSHIYDCENSSELDALANAFKSIHGFALRNPFLWRNQAQTAQIWGPEEFDEHLFKTYGFTLFDYMPIEENRFCTLVSTSIIQNAHSDSDGDLLQLMFLRGTRGQECTKKFVVPYSTEIGRKWDEAYIAGEVESNEKLDLSEPYKLNHIPIFERSKGEKYYLGILCDSAIAKSAVGPGTNNSWLFYMLCELYLYFYNANDERSWMKYNGQAKRIMNVAALMHQADDAYIEILQSNVVTAIKHVEGGSSGHLQFLLKRLGKDHQNMKNVVDIIFNEHHYPRSVGNMICAIAHWAVSTGALDYCDAFLKMHNKGQIVPMTEDTIEWFDIIAENTFFGRMLRPVFEIARKCAGREELDPSEQSSDPEEVPSIDDFM